MELNKDSVSTSFDLSVETFSDFVFIPVSFYQILLWGLLVNQLGYSPDYFVFNINIITKTQQKKAL